MFFVFIRIDSNANELAGDVNEFLLREQTVLRFGVTRSEDAGDTAALGRRSHEQDGAATPFCLGQPGVPRGVPGDSSIAER